MLKRKISNTIIDYLNSNSNKIMIIDGARQIGKSYIIRYIATEVLNNVYTNYIELNFVEDSLKDKLFANINNIDDFYFQLSMVAGDRMGKKENTLVFIDEIQEYPQYLTLLKFLKQDNRFTYICSGSLLGVTLSKTTSIPIGSIQIVHMYPLDFEEFLIANNFGDTAIEKIKADFINLESQNETVHNKLMDLFKKYLLIGGLPDAVNSYLESKNMERLII